jgi:probable phosphoglycerate mutase
MVESQGPVRSDTKHRPLFDRAQSLIRAGGRRRAYPSKVPAPWPSSLWLVRHGESSGNIARDLANAQGLDDISIDAQRDCDVPLSERGREQAHALGEWMAEEGQCPTAILTSPYLRARNTAEIVAREAGLALPVVVDERLREREFGVLDRLTRRGIERRFPEQAKLRKALGKFYHRPPGGESWCDVILRLRSVVDTLTREHQGERVLLVCHSVVVLCFRYLLEQMTEEKILAIDRAADVANCSITSYELSGERLQLRRFNFVAPLKKKGAEVTTEPDVPVRPR